jgi:UDP-2,3-diacylglucosamine hydrolase
VSDIRSERLALPFYFLSDNHLSTRQGPQQKKRIDDMLALLDKIRLSGGTLFILGDFFDFWFDKKNYVPPGLKEIVDALRKIIEEDMEIHYIAGNHDYWIEGYLTREIGLRFYPDAMRFNWEGKDIFCLHGDHIVNDIEQYHLIRRMLRHPLAINLLKCLPAAWIYKLGERVSHYNYQSSDIPDVPDFMITDMNNYLKSRLKEGYDLAISGHVHLPRSESMGQKQIAILGDWIFHRSYGVMDENGFRLMNG